jgi:hypothetical protein
MGAPSPDLSNLWLARAFNAQDVEAAAALYHPDAAIVQVDEVYGSTTIARGADSIRLVALQFRHAASCAGKRMLKRANGPGRASVTPRARAITLPLDPSISHRAVAAASTRQSPASARQSARLRTMLIRNLEGVDGRVIIASLGDDRAPQG